MIVLPITLLSLLSPVFSIFPVGGLPQTVSNCSLQLVSCHLLWNNWNFTFFLISFFFNHIWNYFKIFLHLFIFFFISPFTSSSYFSSSFSHIRFPIPGRLYRTYFLLLLYFFFSLADNSSYLFPITPLAPSTNPPRQQHLFRQHRSIYTLKPAPAAPLTIYYAAVY